MLRIRIIAFTGAGAQLARRLSDGLAMRGHSCTACAMERHAADAGVVPLATPLAQWAAEAFEQADGIVFVAACGIAVRAVAPLLQGKQSDPAVVALDEQGRFAVSLLSGHIGGANRLAEEAAEIAGAQPVVTTATDANRIFSVDSWAAAQGCAILDLPAAKAISAALLDGEPVAFYSDFPVSGTLPRGVTAAKSGALGFSISLSENKRPFATTLRLVPRILTAGVGCRRGAPAEAIKAHVLAVLAANGLSSRALKRVASIDLKAREAGLLAFCKEYNLALITYPAAALVAVPGEFTASAFVRAMTGVDNVCERAALLSAGDSARLLVKKQAHNGVTAAFTARDWRVTFE